MLKDGTVLHGDILEWVRGDHVSVRVAGGDVKRFAWGRVALVVGALESTGVVDGDAIRAIVGGSGITTTTIRSSRSHASDEAAPSTSEAAASIATTEAAAPASSADATAIGPEPAGSPPPIMPSRLALGLQTGYRAPLGRVGIDGAWYPLRWVGFDFGLGLPVDGPSTTAENLFVSWPIYGPLEMGLGAGFTQSFVSGSNGGQSGVVNDLDLEALHLTFFPTRNLSLRAGLGYALNLTGGDYCDAHPSLCPAIRTAYSTLALAWNFDITSGQAP